MDLHVLPRVRDRTSYLYVEHCRIEQDAKSIALHDLNGTVVVPVANLLLLMLGPGTSVSHAAVRTIAEAGCLAAWVGEEGVRYYAQGLGATRSSRGLLRQAALWASPSQRLNVVIRMYEMRFPGQPIAGASLEQMRGREGVRVREAYARASRETGVEWSGRFYNRGDWRSASPVNRALSAANSCLYGVCQAAITAAGFSPAIGFIHTGKMLSFVYDIADLYKAEVSIPAAFRATAEGTEGLESRVRRAMRDEFARSRMLARIIPDIQRALDFDPSETGDETDSDADAALPGTLWDPGGDIGGGVNHGEIPGEAEDDA